MDAALAKANAKRAGIAHGVRMGSPFHGLSEVNKQLVFGITIHTRENNNIFNADFEDAMAPLIEGWNIGIKMRPSL